MSINHTKLIEEDVESGGKEESDTNEIKNDFAYNNSVQNASINIRLGFLRKVYGLLSIQLLLTVVIAGTFMAVEPLKLFVQQNDSSSILMKFGYIVGDTIVQNVEFYNISKFHENRAWTFLLSFAMTMGTLVALFIKRRDHPVNLILLTAFTLAESYTIGIIVSMYDVATVLEALFITLTVMIGLTIFTFQSKRDLSISSSGLFIGLWILLLGGFMQIFIQSTKLEFALCIAGAVIMSIFIVYDTRLLMHTLSPEEYILATINIYLDVINLFLYILRILAISKN